MKAMNQEKTKTLRLRIGAAALSAVLLMGGMVGCDTGTTADTDTESETSVSETYTYRINIEPYRAALFTTDPAYRILVNKQYTVGVGYAPATLTVMDSSLTLYGKEVKLEATAALAAEALVRELWAYGWTNIVITSGYRTYAYQSGLFSHYMEEERAAHPDWTEQQVTDQVLTYSARPGTSEHQTGLCLDLIDQKNPVLDESFASLEAYRWLEQNAHKFGFILRFPKGKEGVTGYSYEPWHYRFVGVETATAIYRQGLTLEEYLGGGA